jgi:hypothetical protein
MPQYKDYTGAYVFTMSRLVYDPDQLSQNMFDAESYPFSATEAGMTATTLQQAITEAYNECHTGETMSQLSISVSTEAYTDAGTSPALSLSDGNELREAVVELTEYVIHLTDALKTKQILD